MRIERINENSIRCTLTSFDLSVRNMNLRELAYGSEKARKLFDEMMAKARTEVGFQAENTPIMIEAIPMSTDSIQLIISKVSDPEELDTRFSRFSPGTGFKKDGEDWISKLTSVLLEGASGLIDQLQKIDGSGEDGKAAPAPEAIQDKAAAKKQGKDAGTSADAAPAEPMQEFRAFAFRDLDLTISACRTASAFTGHSRLYKNPVDQQFVLVIEADGTESEAFSKTCNIIAEYGRMLRTVSNTPAYYEEHYQTILKDGAIQKLAKI